jgi:hypothetical protein
VGLLPPRELVCLNILDAEWDGRGWGGKVVAMGTVRACYDSRFKFRMTKLKLSKRNGQTVSVDGPVEPNDYRNPASAIELPFEPTKEVFDGGERNGLRRLRFQRETPNMW